MSSTTHFSDSTHFQQQSDEFLTWLTALSGVKVNPKIQIADLRASGAGRGVVARLDLEEGEELFTIPRAHVLSAQNSKLKDLISQDLEELGPWLSLMVVMIYEYLRGDQSPWAPYFRVLPRDFDTLMFWSPSELAELQGSAIVNKIGRQGAEESILESVAPLVRANPSLFPPIDGLISFEGDVGTQALLQLAHTMGSLIMASAFDIEKPEDEDERDGEDGYVSDEEEGQSFKGMVPLADLLNADANRNNARLFHEEETLVMKAIKFIRAGEEIYNDYGEIPRSDLLRRYGYVTDNYAPFDVIEVSLSHICQAAGLPSADVESQPPLQFLEELELLDDGYVIPRPSSEDQLIDILQDELLLLLKTLSLSPELLQKQISKGKPPKPTFGEAEATILGRALELNQAQYPTTIAQDLEILARLSQSGALGAADSSLRRKAMALQVRLGEKEILERLFTMLNNELSSRADESATKRPANGDHDDSRRAKPFRS
ncbi:ribosomal lysine N-methyltransferase [Aspergillus saccharolyticus JOP 1030-1]|uniref:SET domain-containing protein n=1 Tax=Aspergillus saccharolyticus JOP 1030-1 TaxID=1450539 RepID=A0A319A952_9EURO|nr:SET domain-containing protein [Aspergillus saccharolyticus JOP 1030-1]PYH48228.1 SET domain-containing protein [Aspergillus saccharolyticus JOP 1030-1]